LVIFSNLPTPHPAHAFLNNTLPTAPDAGDLAALNFAADCTRDAAWAAWMRSQFVRVCKFTGAALDAAVAEGGDGVRATRGGESLHLYSEPIYNLRKRLPPQIFHP
jgi:hypothetical protein